MGSTNTKTGIHIKESNTNLEHRSYSQKRMKVIHFLNFFFNMQRFLT